MSMRQCGLPLPRLGLALQLFRVGRGGASDDVQLSVALDGRAPCRSPPNSQPWPGVYWFRAWCHAAGTEPGASYRSTLRALCPDLLRAPFEAEARAAVGMPEGWYNPQLWDVGERRALEEAAARKRADSGPALGRPAGEAPGPGPGAPATGLPDELRSRLAAFALLEEGMTR